MWATTYFLVIHAAIRGVTTNKTTDKNRVAYGTVTLDTPNSNPTIGTKATSKIRSFTAIIYPTQSAILTIGGIYISPEFVKDKIEPRKVVELTVAEDHRIIDGVIGAKFLMRVVELIENPSLMNIKN